MLSAPISASAQAGDDWTRLARPVLERSWGVDATALSVTVSADSQSDKGCIEGAADLIVLRVSPSSPVSEASAWIQGRRGYQTVVCRVRIRIDGSIPVLVARREIGIGQMIGSDDLDFTAMPLKAVRQSPLRSLPADAVAVFSLQAGEPISNAAVRQRSPIVAGQPVRLQAVAGSARVEIMAVAMTDAALGQLASFKTGSGNTLRARIMGAGAAEVTP